jgi:hypothetical protein
MEKALKIINGLVEKKIIDKYAIGGSIAALFYIEPTVTYDLDIMVLLSGAKNELAPLYDIYEWARANNYEFQKEHIIIEGIPVQILPAFNDLITEAIVNSIPQKYNDIMVNVIGPEYLVAIMLNTYRPIDRERMIRFFKEFELDFNILNKILKKFNLEEKMKVFKEKYLDDTKD